ncbi:hypothetical protein EI94DRAFT_1743026 [Lactarius quietus]|nr:hypothetical protein EI94DRAFT_1743026 [Lactarius quietus]
MYLFGTPIRRTGASFRRATPGCIRLKLFSSRQEDSSDAVVDDEIDFPLSPSGDLDFHRVKLWWGIRTCLPLEPFSWKVFQPRDRKTISGVAIHNLTYGKQNNLFLLCKPPLHIPLPSTSHTLHSRTKTTDEYKREDLGTWMHEIKWHRRALADDPAWYFNRLVWICVFAWLASLLLVALPECARTRSF